MRGVNYAAGDKVERRGKDSSSPLGHTARAVRVVCEVQGRLGRGRSLTSRISQASSWLG